MIEGERIAKAAAEEQQPNPMEALFHPRAVAVVGASRKRGTVGAEIFHNLMVRGFPGAIYPVNRNAGSVQSVRAYRNVGEIPERVDLAVVAVPADQVLATVDECIAAGVRGLVVISAGFGETGPEGLERQRALTERVRAAGVRMIGPNCLGVLSTDPLCPLNATFAPTWPPEGNVAFSSQSGAVGLAVLDMARELGIGVSQFASVGNRADVSGNDLLEFWESDPRTSVILLYLESFGNPRRFMQIAGRVARKKPIIAVKSGRTAVGARAAGSHTGALATADVAVDALLGQAGVIRTDTIEQLFDVASLLANQPAPTGNRVAILTNAGGPGIMAADACETHGLALPTLSVATTLALRRLLPAEASVKNPIDMIASAPPAAYAQAMRLLLADEGIDALMVLYVPPLVTSPLEVAAAIREAAVGARKPILTCLIGGEPVVPARELLRQEHLPVYRFPENASLALSQAVAHGQWLARPIGKRPEVAEEARTRVAGVLERAKGEALQSARRDVPQSAKREALPEVRALPVSQANAEGGTWLSPGDVQEVLAAYEIPTPLAEVVASPDAACAAAERLGFPVAIKLVSDTLTHKTEVGGVILGLATSASVRAACAAMQDRLASTGQGSALRGFLVQKMAPVIAGSVETFIGLTGARDFGSLVAFGLGGTALELHRDVVFRVNPITDLDASDMLDQIRGAAALKGFRGRPPVDRAALAGLLLRASCLAEDFPDIVEVDLNPVLVFPEGQGALVLDARIRMRA